MQRRKFLKTNLLAYGAGGLTSIPGWSVLPGFNLKEIKSKRPPKSKRTFTSQSVDDLILEITANIKDKERA